MSKPNTAFDKQYLYLLSTGADNSLDEAISEAESVEVEAEVEDSAPEFNAPRAEVAASR